jgi:poly(U)-specific endoribonuclease
MKGYLSKNDAEFRKLIEETWFTIYSRGHHKKSSSGFEHVFLGELNNSQVSGFHNWLFFHHEEKRNKLNYLGWLRTIEFDGKVG